MNEEQNDTTPKESKELQPTLQSQVEGLSPEDRMLFDIYTNENQAKLGVPEIRVSYDEDQAPRGEFITIDYTPDGTGKMSKTITPIGAEIEITILRTRFKFGYFDSQQGEKGMEVYGTPELDDYNGDVDLWNNIEKRVIYSGNYKSFKKFIIENYPDPELLAKTKYEGSIIKHTEILYVEYQDKVYRTYLSKSSRDDYWKYKDEIKGVPPLTYLTKLSTTKEKAGSITYFPIHFVKVKENAPLSKFIQLRAKLDADLKVFDSVREGVKGGGVDKDTVKGQDPEQAIIEKCNLDIGKERPNCPKCGSTMVIRDSFKGPFFGCPKFPACDGTLRIEEGMQIKEAVPVIQLEEEPPTPETDDSEPPINVPI